MKKSDVTRRDFVKGGAAVLSSGVLASTAANVYAAGSDEIKLGVIGCGGRGTGAVTQALMGPKHPVKLWAMGDLFRDKLDRSYDMLVNGAEARYDRDAFDTLRHKMDVPEERKFVGFDAYRKVLDSGVDMVILACPPGYRARHFAAAVAAGKHIFMEKPVAVDPVGIRTVMEAARESEKKKLSVIAGTQRRHQKHYIEIMKAIHDGRIGDIVGAQVYWNNGGGPSLTQTKPAGMSDMEWQNRHWYVWCWLSGDHIAEQHVHNLDIMNWAFRDEHPVSCMGMGGRAARQGGDIYDHFAVEFEFPGGVRVLSMCNHIPKSAHRVSERIVGSKGVAYIDSSFGYIEQNGRRWEPETGINPYYQEHIDLVDSIVHGKGLNEGVQVAQSTLCAIMGRMSAYTGRALKWDWALKGSKLDLGPEKYAFTDLPEMPVAMPGKTQLM